MSQLTLSVDCVMPFTDGAVINTLRGYSALPTQDGSQKLQHRDFSPDLEHSIEQSRRLCTHVSIIETFQHPCTTEINNTTPND